MARSLHIIAGPDKGRTFILSEAEPLQIGRSKTTATQLNDPRVSRVHCHVKLEGGRVLVNDSSTAGTFVNGKKVTQQELRPGDIVQVGDTQLRLVDDASAEQTTVAPGAAAAPKPAAAVEQLTELEGKTLSHYEIGPILAKGSSGYVFRARDAQKDLVVALQVLHPEFSKNEEEMQRFVRAMKTMMPLQHPHLVALYGAGKTGPHCWMAMEYIEGESMTQVIKRIGLAGMLDWRYGLRVGIHVSHALAFAAQHQIVHRNVTPQNIVMRTSDKVVKLGDLMLAKALEGTMAQQITKPGELLGDVRYMSPERTRGTSDIDGRSDIYELGATVYALLTGRPPFEGTSLIDTVQKIRTAELVKPKKYQLSIPDQFEGTVVHMLAKRPEDRFQKAADLLADLERVAKLQGVTV